MEIWIGTTNKGKLSEFTLLFQKELPTLELKNLSHIPSYSQPPENGKTFEENARIKVRSLKAMKSGQWVFAEDSGLEVDALAGLPGIHSARYAGPNARDSENVAKVLKMMQIKQATSRDAKFVCTLIAYNPAGEELIFRGELKGQIAKLPAGQMGFGYDPIFIPEGQTKTLAELGPGFKIQNSHRTQATKALIEKLKL